MKQSVIYLALCILLVATSCKKSNDSVETASLAGKWNLKSWASSENIGGSVRNDSDTYPAGDYLQFDGNGECIARVDDEISSTTYELLDNGKTIWIRDNGVLDLPEDGFTIQKLTGNELELYSKETDNYSTYEITIYLGR